MPMSQHCSTFAATIGQGQTDYSHWEAAVPSETNGVHVCTTLRAERTMRAYEGGSDAGGS